MSREDSVETVDRLPPGPIKKYSFDGGRIEALARFATWIPGDPGRLYTFGATEVTVGDNGITPPSKFDDGQDYATMRAYYSGKEEDVIIYFLETWGDDAVIGFAESYAIIELHELSHWAVPVEDNEDGTDHWDRWNRTLTGVVEYVMDIDEWDLEEYQPPEVEESVQEPDKGTQATFPEVLINAN